jgi:hypothetical protein
MLPGIRVIVLRVSLPHSSERTETNRDSLTGLSYIEQSDQEGCTYMGRHVAVTYTKRYQRFKREVGGVTLSE